MPGVALSRVGACVVESGPGGQDLAAGVPQWLEAPPDPRSPHGRIYPLACLIAIAVCAFTAAGNDRFTAVGQWIRPVGQADLAPVPGRDQGIRHQHRPAAIDGPAVVAAYHDLYQVEHSFRMTKSDLAARPVFHRLEDSIQAHLNIVFATLAVSREAQARAGVSIDRLLKVLRPLRSATVTIGAQQVTAQPRIPAEARTLLNDLGWRGH